MGSIQGLLKVLWEDWKSTLLQSLQNVGSSNTYLGTAGKHKPRHMRQKKRHQIISTADWIKHLYRVWKIYPSDLNFSPRNWKSLKNSTWPFPTIWLGSIASCTGAGITSRFQSTSVGREHQVSRVAKTRLLWNTKSNIRKSMRKENSKKWSISLLKSACFLLLNSSVPFQLQNLQKTGNCVLLKKTHCTRW